MYVTSNDHLHTHALLHRTVSDLYSSTSFCKTYKVQPLCHFSLPGNFFLHYGFCVLISGMQKLDLLLFASPQSTFKMVDVVFAAFCPNMETEFYIICHSLIAQPLLCHAPFNFQSRFLKYWIIGFTPVHLLICPKITSSTFPGFSPQRKPQCGKQLTSLWKTRGCWEFT